MIILLLDIIITFFFELLKIVSQHQKLNHFWEKISQDMFWVKRTILIRKQESVWNPNNYFE